MLTHLRLEHRIPVSPVRVNVIGAEQGLPAIAQAASAIARQRASVNSTTLSPISVQNMQDVIFGMF